MTNSNIKSMKLYNHVDRIYNELREIGKNDSDPLNVSDLVKFDQLHYCGLEAIDYSIKQLGINSKNSILEIGSGLGGPARYIAHKTGAKITALELQHDQNNIAKNLTNRCNLSKNVIHICGDILNHNWKDQKFDIIVSWLSLFHIREHKKLLTKCFDLLNSEGYFYAEDLINKGKFTKNELVELSLELYANYLPDGKTYKEDLINMGFNIILFQDMTKKWNKFTLERYISYDKERDRNLRIHGESVVESLSSFYNFIVRYFSGGKLGGIRVIAKKNL